MPGTFLDQKDYMTDLCNQMLYQLRDSYDPDKVNEHTRVELYFFLSLFMFSNNQRNSRLLFTLKVIFKMKVVSRSKDGVVASEAKRAQAQWVVLDK